MLKCFKNYFVLFVSLLFLVVTLSGCVPLIIGAAAGAGGVSYIKGSLERNFDKSVEDVHEACLAGLKDLELFITSDELNLHSATIKFEFESGKKGSIGMQAITELSSKLKIRIGIMGDQTKSQMIMNAIQRNLE